MEINEVAQCIKELEYLGLKVRCGLMAPNAKGMRPVEYYFVNEFPFYSAFCYCFRDYQRQDGKIRIIKNAAQLKDKSHNCFCPKQPNGSPCILSGTTDEMLKRIEKMDVGMIEKYLTKINFLEKYPEKVRKLADLWMHISIRLNSRKPTLNRLSGLD